MNRDDPEQRLFEAVHPKPARPRAEVVQWLLEVGGSGGIHAGRLGRGSGRTRGFSHCGSAAGRGAPCVPPAAAPRILVVDDHPANREVARLMLNVMGCEVDQAEDGDQAVRLCQTNDYDLILMDVRMPRIDGLAATRAIRALGGRAARTATTDPTAASPAKAANMARASPESGWSRRLARTPARPAPKAPQISCTVVMAAAATAC